MRVDGVLVSGLIILYEKKILLKDGASYNVFSLVHSF